AVRAADLGGASPERPVALRVVGRVMAGSAPGPAVAEAQAVRIMTGAPLPPGADCVVRVEDTDAEAEAGVVRVLQAPAAGQSVRAGGEDMSPGERVLVAGDTLTPGAVGLAA